MTVSENTYEDVELIVKNVEKMKLDKTPPEPPPRNIILKPVKSNIYRWSGSFALVANLIIYILQCWL